MKLAGWATYPNIEAEGFYFELASALLQLVAAPGEAITYGLGRSYGDCALNNKIIFSRHFDKILHFSPDSGIVTCESGASLNDIIESFLPLGWFPHVVPGTKYVTVGGAVASDIHGKNHHLSGCFSEYVISFNLMLPDGSVVNCSRQQNNGLFRATCGGMGLTGVILDIAFRLKPIRSAFIHERTISCRTLEETLNGFEENAAVPYSVAWLDCFNPRPRAMRSVISLGEHTQERSLRHPPHRSYTLPFSFNGVILNKYAASMFNRLYYRKRSPTIVDRIQGKLVSLAEFFFPLDNVSNWNRLYGRKGFVQYNLVLPKESSLAGMSEIFRRINSSGETPFLAVLKLFGPENKNLLSFPLEGYTLALDFKVTKKLFRLLDDLDSVVADHGGRLYLAKDARMSKSLFRIGYPKWPDFVNIRRELGANKKFHSLQSRRLGL